MIWIVNLRYPPGVDMRFDVYCDESRPELLSSERPEADHMLIGSLWIPTDSRARFKARIHALRERHRVGPEFKWQKVSRSRLGFYTDLVRLFAEEPDMRFRCIVIDRREVDLIRFQESDPELGFYKFYYQLLHHWILDFNEYVIFCDFKLNRSRDRLEVLRRCLSHANLTSVVVRAQAVRSEESVLIQTVDVLTGLSAARINNSLAPGSARENVVEELERAIRRRIEPTSKSEQKLNVFRINLQGGW